MSEPPHLTATRASYDAMAVEYAETFRACSTTGPSTAACSPGSPNSSAATIPIRGPSTLGSGPGEVTAHLHRLGLDVRGVDLSPVMVEIARRTHPRVVFEVGETGALDAGDASLAAVVSWYSLIHIPGPSVRR